VGPVQPATGRCLFNAQALSAIPGKAHVVSISRLVENCISISNLVSSETMIKLVAIAKNGSNMYTCVRVGLLLKARAIANEIPSITGDA
jgi:hypothetical protein